MPKSVRALLAVVAGLVAWFALGTLGNFVIRALVPDYAAVEKAMNFTLPMLWVRLALGAACTVAGGAACTVIARQWTTPRYLLALVVVLLFIPVHIGLWTRFPVWYHLLFLGSLVPLTLLGARLPPRAQAPGR